MKKSLLLIPVLCLLASACNDEKQDIFPQEYHKILYLKNSGTQPLAMNTTQDTYRQSLLVIKAGAHPESDARGRLDVLTLREAAAIWGYNESDIRLLPSDGWRLSQDSFDMRAQESYRDLSLDFYPSRLYQAMQQAPEATWILPVQLSSTTDRVNEDYSRILFVCSVTSPRLVWTTPSDENAMIALSSLDYELKGMLEKATENAMDFTATLEVPSKESNVNAYNTAHGTSYLPLPESSYTLGSMRFSPGNVSSESALHLTRNGLTSDKTYLLPVRIRSLSTDRITYSGDIKYVIVENPKYAYEEVTPEKWKIAFVNSEDRRAQYMASNCLLRSSTYNYASPWNAAQQTALGESVDDFRYPDEGRYPGTITYSSGRLAGEPITLNYPSCDAVRNWSDLVLVIDLGETINIHSVGLSKMAGDNGNLDLKGCEFFTESQFTLVTADRYKGSDETRYKAAIANYNTANDGNSWRSFLEWSDIPKGTVQAGLPLTWKQVPDAKMNTAAAKGRYLKLHPTDSYRTGSKCIEISDIYIRRLLSINGVPVN